MTLLLPVLAIDHQTHVHELLLLAPSASGTRRQAASQLAAEARLQSSLDLSLDRDKGWGSSSAQHSRSPEYIVRQN